MKEFRKKQLFLVGNGPIKGDLTGVIDGSDFVVRFNEPKQSIGMSGVKTDWLFIANAGKPMQRRLGDPSYFTSPVVAAARRVFLVYHPDIIRDCHPQPNFLSKAKGRRGDWTYAAVLAYGRADKEVTILPPGFYKKGCLDLGIPESKMKSFIPSTGYFGTRYVLNEFPTSQWDINLCGFTWEGWKRHPWGGERQYVERFVEQGYLTVW